MLSLRVYRDICTRSFHIGRSLGNRFTREGLRGRLKQNEAREAVKNGYNQGGSDARPVRPMRDLFKALQFTVFTGATTFTIAIAADVASNQKREQQFRNLYDHVKKAFANHDMEAPKLKDSDKHMILLVGLNIAVFALWKVPQLQHIMTRFFTNSFASKALCSPMLLSAFSHKSLIHLGLNMYVTSTFLGPVINKFLGVEQFWAFYLTSAVVSSFVSLADKALVRSPVRALGASGAILALLTYTCMKVPESRLSILFIPNFDFSAQNAVYGIIAFDLLGLLFRFRLFDHAAHLGGSLFGVFYALWGEQIIWNHYGTIVENMIRRKD